jgi:hypothetical protein
MAVVSELRRKYEREMEQVSAGNITEILNKSKSVF